ncbi:hypothetical protein KOF26_01115 [Sphingomonas sp. XMGL2]|uniref:Uncharacterized protein n=1 Tax=Sphingomonas quercus TaxID=2842451 RepID=A0ABS6BGQ4_9SPHN|nr:hypothetical protein [Sphingomonas quercus]
MTTAAGIVLASLPAGGQGAVLRLSLCGSGAPIELPIAPGEPPARQDHGGCTLACHADPGRRRIHPGG